MYQWEKESLREREEGKVKEREKNTENGVGDKKEEEEKKKEKSGEEKGLKTIAMSRKNRESKGRRRKENTVQLPI